MKDKPYAQLTRAILTDEEKELIENMLLCSLLSEEEILITYYEDGYLLSSYMTILDIDQQNSAIICTNAFYNKMPIGGVYDGETIEGNQSMPYPSGETETGNGYARSTFIKLDDTTSPVTTDNAPTDRVNKNVTVNLTATDSDEDSGVASTYYQLDNGSTQSGNAITISDEGIHTLTYWSVDNAGNTEKIFNNGIVITVSFARHTLSLEMPYLLKNSKIRSFIY